MIFAYIAGIVISPRYLDVIHPDGVRRATPEDLILQSPSALRV